MMPVLPPFSASDAAAMLEWMVAMGADESIDFAPRALQSRVAETPNEPVADEAPRPSARGTDAVENAATPRPVRIAASPHGGEVPASLAAAIAEASRLAAEATTIEALQAAVRAFDGCPLKKTATQTVFADGNPASGLMLIGEAPGAEEDKQGIPFCGPSGKLLDKMLSAIGRNRDTGFYITNTLFWRPPGNRQPTPEELEICRPFVEKHIALVQPRCLLLVGGTATKAVLGESRGITRLRGQVFPYHNPLLPAAIPAHVIYHPSFLLRQPLAKRQTWADLQALRLALGTPSQ